MLKSLLVRPHGKACGVGVRFVLSFVRTVVEYLMSWHYSLRGAMPRMKWQICVRNESKIVFEQTQGVWAQGRASNATNMSNVEHVSQRRQRRQGFAGELRELFEFEIYVSPLPRTRRPHSGWARPFLLRRRGVSAMEV